MPNPLAPIAHHWLDSTHITFGVVTGALYGQRWKAEASVFNGRELDEDRTALSAGFVPEALKSAYGSRVNMGFAVFLTLRPAAMMMMHRGHMHHGGGGSQ